MRSPFPSRHPAGFAVPLACLSLLAAPAGAGDSIPSPWTCEIGTTITLTGSASGHADPLGATVIVVRKFATPIPNALVEIDFRACGSSEFALCEPQLDPGLLDWSPGHYLTYTDADGRATFRLVGRATGGAGGGVTEPCAEILANGVRLGTIRVSALDLDGIGGVGPGDLSLFLRDRFGSYHTRSDYDGDGTIDPTDFSRLLRARFAGGSAESCVATAP